MERSNQSPKPEDCSAGGALGSQEVLRGEQPKRSVSRDKREPQVGPASGLSNSASKSANASGEGVLLPASHAKTPDTGEGEEGLPGSQSVASAERSTWNEGGPESSCRTNCEGQAGRQAQPKEASAGDPGVGWVHSSRRQGQGPDAGEGTHESTQSAEATHPVRTTGKDWQTFLQAIAEKASTAPQHRFGDLYRKLNRDVLRICFYQLRKDAASGVDRVSFQDYEKNLEENLADLEQRLRRKGYRARLVRRKYIPKGNGKQRPLGIPTVSS